MSLKTQFPDIVREWNNAKQAAGIETLILLRVGDFYEAFFDDAHNVAATCGLSVTTRTCPYGNMTMTGFPYHQLDGYVAKLVASGFRVAVCDKVPPEQKRPEEGYRLKRPEQGKRKPKQFHDQPGLQRNLIDGLDCLPGQMDLFNEET